MRSAWAKLAYRYCFPPRFEKAGGFEERNFLRDTRRCEVALCRRTSQMIPIRSPEIDDTRTKNCIPGDMRTPLANRGFYTKHGTSVCAVFGRVILPFLCSSRARVW
jgi:hypothetical protein